MSTQIQFFNLSDSPTIKRNNKENSPFRDQLQNQEITTKIVNEMLNSGSDYLQEQLQNLNVKIVQYQQNIKHKITQLLNDSQSVNRSFDSTNLQRQLSDFRFEEQTLMQQQMDIERQQNQVYDYYEGEFNKLKVNYENASLDHQKLVIEKGKAHEEYGRLLESKAMLQEDLNARLLQRAELVGQKEELEECVDQVSRNCSLFDLIQAQFQIDRQINQHQDNIAQLENIVRTLNTQKEEKKAALNNYQQVTQMEVQLHQANHKLKLLKNKIVPLQKSLNLQHPDLLINEFMAQGEHDLNVRLPIFIQQYRNSLFRSGNSGTNWGGMKEYVTHLEQLIQQAVQQRILQNQLNDFKNNARQYGDEAQLQSELSNLEFQLQVKRAQIEDLLSQISELSNQEVQPQIELRIEEVIQQAFQSYIDENRDSLQEILQEYGQGEYESVMSATQEQLSSLIHSDLENQFKHTLRLMHKFQQQEQSIRVNITMVDQQILPQLRGITQNLSKMKREIEKLNEKPHQDKLQKLEQEIQSLESEFKSKIQFFQQQELDLTCRQSHIKGAIEATQDQLRGKPNKALLEQEILQLNNILTSLQDQKAHLEGLNQSSRKSSQGVLAISKSLNQFTKLRKDINVTASNQIVKGITPTKDTQNLYLINKYQNGNSRSGAKFGETRMRQNFSMKSIK